MSVPVVGREAELCALEEFIGSFEDGLIVLALEGEAGIGKTTIWQEGLRLAGAGGWQVLSCRPADSEAGLSFAGLVDLLAPVGEEALAALPGPQRLALEVALVRAQGGRRPDRMTISVALLSLLQTLAAVRPVLVAVDDAQWLDRSSAAALEFVTRRLERVPVRVLTSVRVSDEPVTTFDRVAGDRRRVLRVGPLSAGVLHTMIQERLGRSFPRPTLVKIARVSGGNPFYALEIARALSAGYPRAGEPLPVPDDLGKLVRARIRRLPPEARSALLVASALSVPTVGLVDRHSLVAAEEAGIVRVAADGRVEFTHPLFASAVYSTEPAGSRRDVHRRLAAMVDDIEERARHLALAVERPDEDVAEAVEAGAVTARCRGAWGSAAELLERARELTPPDRREAADRRGVQAAVHHVHGGDRPRARRLLEELLTEGLPRALRCEALRVLAEISLHDESFADAEHLFGEALALVDDPRVAARIECGVAFVRSNLADWAGGKLHANRALELAEPAGDAGIVAQALGYCAMFDYLCGRGVDWAKVERSVRLEDLDVAAPLHFRPSAVAALLILFVHRLSEARVRLRAVRAGAVERGDESDLAFVLLWSGWLETLAGDFAQAAAITEDALVVASSTGSHSAHAWLLGQRAFVSAHRGDADEARRDCAEAVKLGTFGHVLPGQWLAASLGLLELSLGNAHAAWVACEAMTTPLEVHGIGEPSPCFFLPVALEALIEIGQLERAEALIDTFERRGTELDRAWALATGGRCRGLLLAARGDLAGAQDALQAALRHHDRLEMPFERARTVLCLGRVQRRAKQRKAARDTLGEAADTFERLGARLWAANARAELDRTHVRQAPAALTPSEAQVARLAASGLRNREIAERLFLSPKTVETNLARAYRKLNVGSRAQLAAAIAADESMNS